MTTLENEVKTLEALRIRQTGAVGWRVAICARLAEQDRALAATAFSGPIPTSFGATVRARRDLVDQLEIVDRTLAGLDDEIASTTMRLGRLRSAAETAENERLRAAAGVP